MQSRRNSRQAGPELERRRRNRLLTELLAELDAKYGPVADSLVEKYVGLLT